MKDDLNFLFTFLVFRPNEGVRKVQKVSESNFGLFGRDWKVSELDRARMCRCMESLSIRP